MKIMEYKITRETFDSLFSYWREPGLPLDWTCLFVSPPWLKVWWNTFGNSVEPHLFSVRQEGELIGIAPLLIENGSGSFIGDVEVCDYQDFIVAPGKAEEFFRVVMDHLAAQGTTSLDLRQVHPGSTVMSHMADIARDLGCRVTLEPEDESAEMTLPGTWDEFLLILRGKERHEVRRKLRRLSEAGDIRFRAVENLEGVRSEMDTFLKLFESNRPDKANFMTGRMASFFRSLAEALAEVGIAKIFFLELDAEPTAAVMCFEYHSTMYLYNNGYDHKYSRLSVGLLCKVLCIKESIERGIKKYDFLKGSEVYKSRLGGETVSLYRCHISMA